MADDGGPAFPVQHREGGPDEGMSLRDYFAGQALVGILMNFGPSPSKYRAGQAYEFADAMLEARKR